MLIPESELESLATRLRLARQEGCSGPPLTESHPLITSEEAYAISKLNYHARLLVPGVHALGKKIGLTSQAVQSQLGVKQPDFGYLTSDMLIPDGGSLTPASLIHGRAEGEVAFVLKADLKGPSISSEQVVAATDYVVACIEIIDSRIKDWKIKIQDTVADNASSAYLVLGQTHCRLDGLDLRMAGMTLKRNGEIESTGVGAACMDHPVLAVQWLANMMGSLGETLRAGDVILSGAYGPVVPFFEGDRVEVEISGLGKVSCNYASRAP